MGFFIRLLLNPNRLLSKQPEQLRIFIDMIHVAEGLNAIVVFRKWLVGTLEVLPSLRLWIFFIISAFPHKSSLCNWKVKTCETSARLSLVKGTDTARGVLRKDLKQVLRLSASAAPFNLINRLIIDWPSFRQCYTGIHVLAF
jgi:hypothetical protein